MRDELGRQRTAAAAPRVRAADDTVRPASDAEPRFVIGGELGRGGMGRVVAAVDTMLDREVAIKQALADGVDGARFEREARITAQLEHPSIVPIHDAGRDEHGRPYYIMRRIAGEPLAERIAGARDAKTRLALVPRFVVAVDAAGFAHARGIIHRDIKPMNILLGAHGETLLIDWGLARRLDDPDGHEHGHASGTPGYMSPEQARGDRVDASADVYALGATLLDVLTGSPGRGLSSPTRWLARATAGTLSLVEALDPEIPAELVAIVGKALAPAPGDRYRDAGALAADLHAFLDGRLVAAHRYTPLAHLRRFVRRHRIVVAIAVIAVGIVTTTGVLAVRRVIAERDLARSARLDSADRADVLLLDRAAGLAERDPTRAVALLATLPPSSRHTARARDIAAISALHGIEHGAVAHDGAIVALAIAPDRHSLLSAGGYDGTIQIHDLATGTVRTVVRGPVVDHAIWTDHGATITYSAAHSGLRVVELASGAVRTLDPEAVADAVWAPEDGDRVRFHDDKRHIVRELSTSGGEVRVLARDAATVSFDGELLAVAGAGTVRVIDAAGEHVVAHYTGEQPWTLATSNDGARVAAGFRAATFEWEVATGKRLGMWPGFGAMVVYAGTRLYAPNMHRHRQLDVLRGTGSYEGLAADWSVLWSTQAGPRIAVLDATGDLGLLGDDGDRELRFDRLGSRMIAGRRDSPYLAVGSSSGTIRWWDLRQFMPESHRLPNGKLCDVDAERIYVRTLGELAIVPRAGGVTRTHDSAGLSCLMGRVGTSVVTLRDGSAFDVIDGATGRVRHFVGQPVLGPHAIYFARGPTMYEITEAEPIVRWTAPTRVLGVMAADRALGLELEDGRLVRVDSRSDAITFHPIERPSVFQLGADGSWWYAVGARIYHDDHLIGELASPARLLWLTSAGDCMVFTEEQSMWRASSRGFVRLAAVADGPSVSFSNRMIATVRYNAVRFAYPETGEQVTLPIPGATGAFVLDGGRVFAIVRSTDTMLVDLYADPVPADPAKLSDWLRTATNAVVEPGNDAVRWQ